MQHLNQITMFNRLFKQNRFGEHIAISTHETLETS